MFSKPLPLHFTIKFFTFIFYIDPQLCMDCSTSRIHVIKSDGLNLGDKSTVQASIPPIEN